MKSLQIFLSIATILLVLPSDIYSLQWNETDEKWKCDNCPDLVDDWLLVVDKWYIPLWNRVELYRNAEHLLGKENFTRITPSDLALTCGTYEDNGNGTGLIFKGFGNQEFHYTAKPDLQRPGLFNWYIGSEFVATSFTSLTDNESFMVNIALWRDGKRGFTVGSPFQKLSKDKLEVVKRHLIEEGFQKEYFVYLDYDLC